MDNFDWYTTNKYEAYKPPQQHKCNPAPDATAAAPTPTCTRLSDRELMQQALDALEQYTDVVTSVNDPNSWVTVADGGKPAREAITALRERLAQPNQWQGLTEAEKVNVALECGCADVAWIDLADAIEAKLKTKNT